MDDPASETVRLKAIGGPHPRRVQRSFCLIVMEGPYKGATFSLSLGRHLVGRTHDCDIVLHGSGVSRVHAALTINEEGVILVEDLGSTNGLYLDGKLIVCEKMEPGQTLSFGPEVRLRLELSTGGVQQLLREMFQTSTQDGLTGLFNRRGFEQRLEVEFAMVCRHSMHSCLAVLDIDHFKKVNDQEGHDAGDAVLGALADILRKVRTGDLACRWGGEEFALYIRQAPLAGGITMLERLRQQFENLVVPLPLGGTIQATFSAGVVDLLDFDDWRKAFRAADQALYEAKADGRNRVRAWTR